MLFNSYLFILVFLPGTLIGYFCLNHWGRFTLGKTWLVLLSLVFYAYTNPACLPIIIGSVLVNYALSQCMLASSKQWLRTLCFAAGLTGNLGALIYYKYYNFFVSNINAAFSSGFPLLHLALPLGISYLTFKQLSYIVDSYQRQVPRYRFMDYTLFVTFFPHLIAGPIVLHSEILPQVENIENGRFRADHFNAALYAFARGLAKKVLIADTFAKVAAYGFLSGTSLSGLEALLVVLSYTFQLYFDFSGYCDMAVGLGKMFNINLPLNFNSPYQSLSIKDFWARWHMTLGRFFSRYVYIPLGGSRKGLLRTCLNLMVVFVLSGLWHDAGWLFLLWGLLHGLASVAYRLCHTRYDKLPAPLRWLLTFTFVSLTWVFFRAPTMAVAGNILRSLFTWQAGPLAAEIIAPFAFPFGLLHSVAPYLLGIWFLGALAAVVALPNTQEMTARFSPTLRTGLVTVLLLVFSILSLSGVSVFLYSNF